MLIRILIIIAIIIIMLFIIIYNSLMGKKNAINNAYSGADTILQKRYDLIPNLVNVVKGYTAHENSVLQNITELRSKLNTALPVSDKVTIDNEISTYFNRIFAVSESYPDLKASTNFLELQKELVNIEDELAAARRTFNATVNIYNNEVQMFPSNIVASMTGFKPMALFQTMDRENIKVEL